MYNTSLPSAAAALRGAMIAVGLVAGSYPALAQAPASPPPGLPLAAAPAPACDAGCVRANADRAVLACAPRIEAEAPTDFDWISRPYGSIFQEADTPPAGSSVIQYTGDSVRFLSPQKEWVRVTYSCGFDAAKGQVTAVRVRLGRLGKPQPVAGASAASTGSRTAQAAPAPAPNPAAPPAATPVTPTSSAARVGEPNVVEVLQVNPLATRKRTP